MKQETQWIITEVDGRIASVAPDYRHFAAVAARIAAMKPAEIGSVSTRKLPTQEVFALAKKVSWEDLLVFGTKFQKSVLKSLFDASRPGPGRLMSYTDFAALCGFPTANRQVAHVMSINPIAVIIPCHLVVPKESMDRVAEIRADAEASTLFRGSDLYLLDTIDVGEYAYGPVLKRELIKRELGQ